MSGTRPGRWYFPVLAVLLLFMIMQGRKQSTMAPAPDDEPILEPVDGMDEEDVQMQELFIEKP